MSVELVIKMDPKEWRFSGEEVNRLKNCSDAVKNLMDEREELDPDNTEDIELYVTSEKFMPIQVDQALDYLKNNNYNPPQYGKVISNILSKNVEDEAGRQLAEQYDFLTIHQLLAAAEYLQIPSLSKLC